MYSTGLETLSAVLESLSAVVKSLSAVLESLSAVVERVTLSCFISADEFANRTGRLVDKRNSVANSIFGQVLYRTLIPNPQGFQNLAGLFLTQYLQKEKYYLYQPYHEYAVMQTIQIQPYKPTYPIRIVTAASLFDGHDAAINIMRRIIQASGAEVIHLGHNRSVAEIVNCAIQEDVQGIAITSYQGGHVEFLNTCMT